MTTVYLVMNSYRTFGDEGEYQEIAGLAMSREGAEMILHNIVRRCEGVWTSADTVFEADSEGMESDVFYIDEAEATA
jgi:hypothetical protein